MARTVKLTVDYFPHVVKHGRTLFILESRWKNDGYACLFKLFETLCDSDGMVFDFKDPIQREVFLARIMIPENTVVAILDVVASMGTIDRELWSRNRIVWSQDLVDNLKEVWRRRSAPPPQRPDLCRQYAVNNRINDDRNAINADINAINDDRNAQSRVEKSREEGRVPHIAKDIHLDTDTDTEKAPPALPASPSRSEPNGAAETAADGSDKADASIKNTEPSETDILVVAGSYLEARGRKFQTDAARQTYMRTKQVYFKAKDLLALAGGDLARACKAIADLAEYYREEGKTGWTLDWIVNDFPEWDEEREKYEQEIQR